MLEAFISIAMWCDHSSPLGPAMQAAQVCRERMANCLMVDSKMKIVLKTKDQEIYDCFKQERLL